MPIKVHVKGKRKAPLPPVNSNAFSTNYVEEKNNQNRCLHRTSLNVSCSNIQKRKKQAPLPPSQDNLRLATEMNNLSDATKKVHNNDAAAATRINNLNILECNGIESDVKNRIKNTNFNRFDMNNVNRVYDPFDIGIHNNRNNDIWICSNCTLQNPFWKIVCDACERIKPYNTPNISSTNIFHLNTAASNDTQHIGKQNLLNTVKLRPKAIKTNVSADRTFQRSSMQPEIQYQTRQSNAIFDKEEKIMNRRVSVCVTDVTIDRNALEMEKERIRSVIRSLNNRALAQKYPRKTELTNTNRPVLSNDDNKLHLNAKQSTSRNQSQKYDMKNDYSFPSKDQIHPNTNNNNSRSNYLLQTDDSKAKFDLLKINKSLDRPNKTDEYYKLIGEIKNYCEQVPLASGNNALKKLDLDIYGERKKDIAMTSNNSHKDDAENKMS